MISNPIVFQLLWSLKAYMYSIRLAKFHDAEIKNANLWELLPILKGDIFKMKCTHSARPSSGGLKNYVCVSTRMKVNFEIQLRFLYKCYGHQTWPKTSQWCILWDTCAYFNIWLVCRGKILRKLNRVQNLKWQAVLLTYWPLVKDCWR